MYKKRPRAEFEADLQAQQSPYVVFGTALPPIDPDVRDDGSYVPVWKQEVTDERGRKRLHGAFTGGFSAGYFNTVGSKEGWTPATFVSSRSNRNEDAQTQQKAEDFMDDEDLKEAEESRQVSTDATYSALGSTEGEAAGRRTIMDVFQPTGETMGIKLLRKMGWRDGQGIGPKVRRKARLDDGEEAGDEDGETHLFAPENSSMITFRRKNDSKGLGFEGEQKLGNGQAMLKDTAEAEDEDTSFSAPAKSKPKPTKRSGGFGLGILNDNGSDEEDPYEIGPKITYNKSIGKEKKKKKKLLENGSVRQPLLNSNPLLKDKPIFYSKRSANSGAGQGPQRCHDGRPPLPGFILSRNTSLSQETKYTSPTVPEGWISSKAPSTDSSAPYQPTADLAKSSTLNPSSRAQLLGETPLPGKPVFSLLTPAQRDRIANLTNNPSLPAGEGEIPPPPPPGSTNNSTTSSSAIPIPSLDPSTAAAALGRGTSGFVPYADNPTKQARYRSFLAFRADFPHATPPIQPDGLSTKDWASELDEFAHAATVFRPMTGLMAQRFVGSAGVGQSRAGDTSTKGEGHAASGNAEDEHTNLLRQGGRRTDPAEEAARLGMFGPLTRSEAPFYPSRLLCKRFDVPAPAWTEGAGTSGKDNAAAAAATSASGAAPTPTPPVPDFSSRFAPGGIIPGTQGVKSKELLSQGDMHALMREAGGEAGVEVPISGEVEGKVVVDPERNEVLEQDRPGEEVFRAIFGSDSEDD